LEPSEILVDLRKRAGYAAAEGTSVTVVLDTSLTPELIEEGLARDFVRGVQDARKSAGYRIEDTIAVSYEADPEVVDAIVTHADFVAAETLAIALNAVERIGFSDAVEPEAENRAFPSDSHYHDLISVGRHQVRIALRRTAGTTAVELAPA
jgi:isoleucyl-tRNA synthetase